MQTDSRSTENARRPGRPRRFSTNQILDSALELFWTRGYLNTTTRDLESYLCLNQSSIYNSFGSKKRLLEMVLDRYENLASQALLVPLENSLEGVRALENFYLDLLRWITDDARRGCMLINMMAEDGGDNPGITERTRAYRMLVRKGLETALCRAVSMGEMSEGNSISRSHVLLGLALGINIAARGGASEEELNELVSAVLDQIKAWCIEPAVPNS